MEGKKRTSASVCFQQVSLPIPPEKSILGAYPAKKSSAPLLAVLVSLLPKTRIQSAGSSA